MSHKLLYILSLLAVMASGLPAMNSYAKPSPEVDLLSSTTLKEETPSSINKSFRLTLKKSHEKDDDYSFTILFNDKEQLATLITKVHNKRDDSIAQSEHALTTGQIKNILRFERASNFWKLPPEIKRNALDGAYWILEGVDGGNYHRTSRISPLPPYYSKIMDPVTNSLIKDPNTPPERESKSSDEVGLDMFCMFIMLMHPEYDELIY